MNLGIEVLTLLLFGIMFLLFLTGMPVAYALLFLSAFSFLILRGPGSLVVLQLITLRTTTTEVFLAVPTFIFMALILEMSGLANALYDMMHKWAGGLRGGLAMGTIGISTIMAAMTGSCSTATLTMGIIAYPEMEKRGYDRKMIIGVIPAGGSLGPLIPPSIPMIVNAFIMMLSIGQLFMAGVFPGLITAFCYISYIGIRSWLNPQIGPPLPKEERASWGDKILSLRLASMPIILIFAVLGLIYLGVSTPVEAGGIGATGALICAAINRRLNLRNLRQALNRTFVIVSMLLWLLVTGFAFSQVLGVLGIQGYLHNLFLSLDVNRWVIFIIIQLITYVLGMFIDSGPIQVIFLPIFYPVIQALGFDLLWFALVFTVNIIIGQMTPPFGINLFFFYSLKIPGVSMGLIYRSIIPFVIIMTAVMVLVILVPSLATWLPGQMFTVR